MIVNLKALQNEDYIKCIISRIEFSAIMFIYNI